MEKKRTKMKVTDEKEVVEVTMNKSEFQKICARVALKLAKEMEMAEIIPLMAIVTSELEEKIFGEDEEQEG